jgi:hypothetical protein
MFCRMLQWFRSCLSSAVVVAACWVVSGALLVERAEADTQAPSPLEAVNHPVDWWFAFKFNAKAFPGCSVGAAPACPFGGTVQNYRAFSQQFVYASNEDSTLKSGNRCIGDTSNDPVGATFGQVEKASLYFVIWNDQFYSDPAVKGCGLGNCNSPWGHSKGMVAWNESGEGFALQVSTPSWPGAGSTKFPRKETSGNTLGCIADNDVVVSQHFFSVKLTKDDLVKVLNALNNASIATDPSNHQIVNNGGPIEIQKLVNTLGKRVDSAIATKVTLSTGIVLISKPSNLHVPPWQMVSSMLGSEDLRTATWWAKPQIPTTDQKSNIPCWSGNLHSPGRVEIATSGQWNGTKFGLKGGLGSDFNHAKIGVAVSGPEDYVIFGDLNQQGALGGDCSSSQNGRGGLFYAVPQNPVLHKSVAGLLEGGTAPLGSTN